MKFVFFKKDFDLKKVKILCTVDADNIADFGFLSWDDFSKALRLGKDWGWEGSDGYREFPPISDTHENKCSWAVGGGAGLARN